MRLTTATNGTIQAGGEACSHNKGQSRDATAILVLKNSSLGIIFETYNYQYHEKRLKAHKQVTNR